MKSFRRTVFMLMLAIMVNGCNKSPIYGGQTEDPFYTFTGGFDYRRMPLIKPYEAINGEQGDGWGIELIIPPSQKPIYYYLGIHDAQKIAVEDGLIMAYTEYEEDVSEEVGEKVLYWFVIVPSENIETGFANEYEFLKFIESYGIQEPLWQDPNDIYQQFVKTGCLDWIPGCK